MNRRYPRYITTSFTIILAGLIITLHAEWISDGVPICTTPENQTAPQITTDCNGGAIITWQDYRSGKWEIYAQRIDSDGNTLWTTNGIDVSTSTAVQYTPQIVSDQVGGAYIAWEDGYDDVYAQRITANGNRAWADAGLDVGEGYGYEITSQQVITDGYGGAIVTWIEGDYYSYPGFEEFGLYAQRLNTAGSKLWGTNGITVYFSGMTEVQYHRVIADGQGGAITMYDYYIWECYPDPEIPDYYYCFPTYHDNRAQKIDNNGAKLWGSNGIDMIEPYDSDMASDRSGGVILAFEKYTSTNRDDIYAQRIDDSGNRLWPTTGVPVYTGPEYQSLPKIVSDSDGNSIIAWQDKRNGDTYDIYAQRLDSNGNLEWDSSGVAICTAAGDQSQLQIVSDGFGGAIIVWEDARSDNNIYAQRVDSTGAIQWAVDGRPVCTAAFVQENPRIVSDDNGGVISAWTDERSGNKDIYAYGIISPPLAPPSLVDALATRPGNVNVLFDEVVTAVTAENIINYEIFESATPANTISIIDATLLPDGATVSLSLGDSLLTGIAYTLRVNDVEDLDGMPITPDSEIDITIQRDLRVVITSAPSELNVCGNSLRVIYELANEGMNPAFSFRSSLRLSDDSTITASDVLLVYKNYPGLTADTAITDTLTCQLSYDTQPAIYYLGVFVDDLEQAPEFIEYNNTALAPLMYNAPLITSIEDIGDDQGRWLNVEISRSILDAPDSPVPITQYEVFRRIDQLYQSDGTASLRKNQTEKQILLSSPGLVSDRRILMEGWEFIGAVMADEEESYNFVVPTLADSTANNGIHWSVFFVRAATNVPTVYYDSCPDSAYSIDNLPPAQPRYVSAIYIEGTGNELSWPRCGVEDFQYYRVYRGKSDDFIPFGGNLIHATIDTTWTDVIADGWRYRYKVSAVDLAGNESDPTLGRFPTDAEIPPVPDQYALYQNVPNPFNPVTIICFDIPTMTRARLAIYSIAGTCIRVLVDDVLEAGRKEEMWDGKDERGRNVASGIYFYRLDAGSFSQSKKMVLLR